MRVPQNAGVTLAFTLCAAISLAGVKPAANHYDFRASTFVGGAKEQVVLDAAPNGDLLVAWSSRRQNEGRYGVFAQRFDSRGVAIGSETQLGLWGKSHQFAPDLGVDGRGHAWAVWDSYGQDGSAGAIVARHFGPNFVGGSELLVNQTTRGDQADPVIAIGRDGRAVVAWTASVGKAERVFARVLGADGRPIGNEFVASGVHGRREANPGVAIGPGGQFAIVYAVCDAKGDPNGIRLRLFDAKARPIGLELRASGAPKNSQIEPAIASTGKGYAVSWLDAQTDGSEYGVLARMFSFDGKPLCEPFLVNTKREGNQNAVAVVGHADGTFTIAWNDDNNGVYYREFAAGGKPLGDQQRLTLPGKHQGVRQAAATHRLALLPSGGLAVAWNGNGGFGDKNSANVTMLTGRPIQLAGLAQGVTATMKPAGYAVAENGASPHVPPTFNPNDIAPYEPEVSAAANEVGFTAVNNTGWTPPDPHCAVGPNHVVVMVNGQIAFFTKTGTRTFFQDISGSGGFWGSLGATSFVFDPEVLYDELSGRFFAMASESINSPATSYVLIAVSDDSDPNGTWYKYRISTTALAGYLFDSPNIGVDANSVYVTGDGYGISNNYPVYAFDKATMLAGGTPTMHSTTLATTTQSAGIPPVAFGNPPAYYMIEHQEGSNRTQVRLIALTNPMSTMNFTTYQLTVPAYSDPADPTSKGTSVKPSTFDERFWSCCYRNGSLWATHHINNPIRARWYEIKMNGWPSSGQNPTLVQSGEIVPGTNIYTFFSSITADANNDAAMTFARCASTEYISMYTTMRFANDTLGTMQTPVLRKASNAAYAQSRWGDYSQVNVDPTDDRTFWAHHEYSASGAWVTWVEGWLPTATVTGNITLENLARTPSGLSVQLDFRTPGTTTVVNSYVVTLDASSNFSIPSAITGTFDIAVKYGTWLRKVLAGQAVNGPTTSGLALTLPGGDADNNNTVNLLDLSTTLANFGSAGPDGDLNLDSSVNLLDLSMILSNFGMTGDT